MSEDIAVDAFGNSYVTGYYHGGRANFGDFTLTTNPMHDLGTGYLVKYDVSGKEVWAKNIGELKNKKIAVDAAGNIYLTGYFDGAIQLGNIILAGLNGSFCIVKISPSGEVLWARNTTGSEEEAGTGVAADAFGNCYVSGYFVKQASFGSYTLTSGGVEGFVAKYDRQGQLVWVRKTGGGYEKATGVAVDAEGDVYLTGNFSYTIRFGATSMTSEGFDNLFIAKYSSSGDLLWGKQASKGEAYASNISLDANGNIFLAGDGPAPVSFGSTHFWSFRGFNDMFVVKYDATGEVVWAKKAGGRERDFARGMAVDAAGNCFVSGYYNEEANFDNLTLKRAGDNFFIAKYSPSGQLAWVKDQEAQGPTLGQAVVLDALGNLYLTGHFKTSISFGSTVLTNNNVSSHILSATFVAKVGTESGPAIVTKELTENNYCAGAVIPVFFITAGTFAAGNSFIVQLSDASGSFASPKVIGTGCSSPVSATFPEDAQPGASYKIRVVSTSPGVTGRETSVPVTINALPTAPAVAGSGSCGSGTTVTLKVSSTVAGQSYSWYTSAAGGTALANSTSSVFTTPVLKQSTVYYVSVLNSAGCESSRTAVTVHIDPALSVQAGEDEEVCVSAGNITLADFSPSGGTWTGTGVSTDGVFNPAMAGAGSHKLTYTVRVGNCVGTSTKTMKVSNAPAVSVAMLPTDCGTATRPLGLAPLQARFTNKTTGGTGFLWEFGDGTTSPESAPAHTYERMGSYEVYLTVFYGNGCSVRQRVTEIQVKEQWKPSNIFTPNGDGLNETFVLEVSCLPLNLEVYNRWGKLVYEQVNYQNNWTGKEQPEGAYFYHAEASNGQAWKGWVEIAR